MADSSIIRELVYLAQQVRDETTEGANTARRVGGLLLRIINALGLSIEELDKLYLRKDKEDTAQGPLTIQGQLTANGAVKAKSGLSAGDFVEGISTGKGANIDSNGNAEVESLKVRSYAMFMELIINRLTAQEGDTVFTDSGTIERVRKIDDTSYVLTLRRRWEYDYTSFDEGDVIYGSVNSLLVNGEYRTSWMRVSSVDRSANEITVNLYPDNEVPGGKNSLPSVSMNLSRRGNQTNESRQSCWYISSYEGVIMYLEGVTKPILDESNYYLSVGKPKHLELFDGLPINFSHPYLFARGAIIQDLHRIEYTGNPVYEIVDLGQWDAATQYIRGLDPVRGVYVQHQCWYKSCLWRCVADAATVGLPPRWNNTQWACIVGDSNIHLTLTSTRGNFFRFGQEYTTLVFTLTHGDMDITVDATQVEWTRESGDADEDRVWNVEHSSFSNNLEITPADMPSNWREVKKVVFRCTVTLRDGETYSEEFKMT